MLRHISIILFILLLGDSRLSAQAGSRISKAINLHWTFNYFPQEDGDKQNVQAPEFNDAKWPEVAVPHSWQLYETTGEVHPFIRNPAETDNDYWWKGWGWYRKHFSVDPSQAGKKIFIEFDGVMKYSKVYINGHYLGDHKGGYGGFDFDITSYVKPGKDNVLAVAVNNLRVDEFSTPPMKAGNWNTYGGIIRDVRLVIKSPLYIPMQGSASHEGGTFITTPKVSATEAVVRVQTFVQNDYATAKTCVLKTSVFDSAGKLVQSFQQQAEVAAHGALKFDQTGKPVMRPRLWSPEAPYIYKVVSELMMGNKVVDRMESPMGFRWFHWDYKENFLYINGKKTVLHGGNRHEEYPWLGQAMPKWITESDYHDMAVNLHYNFMRTVHYPNDRGVYDLTDKYGIVIDEELPNDKNQDFDKGVQEQQLKEMIRRDRNHPSIFFWSMGNETNHAADSKWTLTEDTTRIVTARRVLDNSQGEYAPHSDKNLPLESLLACNIRGWYNKDVKNLEPTDGQHAGTEENQHRKLISSGRLANGNLSTWLYADHGCDREYLNEPVLHVNPKGYVDAYRVPKYSYYLWQANYLERPMVWIMPHFWRSLYKGQKKDFTVNSNGTQVELFVNGKSQGIQYPDAKNFHTVVFKDVEVQPGDIKAVAKKNGKTVSYVLSMAGAPALLKATASHISAPAAKSSIVVVKADITDANGIHVFGATHPLTWSIKGPATLVGPSVYTSDIDKNESMDGTMYIDAPVSNLIRLTGQPGEVIVTVQSPGLRSATVHIQALARKDAVQGIIENALPQAGRENVARNPSYLQASVVKVPAYIQQSFDEFHFPGKSKRYYADFISKYMLDKNKQLDASSPAFKALVELFSAHMANNDGRLVADDYNFNIDHFNKAYYLSTVIDKTSLPAPFKQTLTQRYISDLITKGIDRDVSAAEKLVTTVPLQGKMGMVGNSNDPAVQGFSDSNLDAMVRAVYGATMDEAAIANVKHYLALINPALTETVTNSQVRGEDRKTVVSYTVEPNQVLWFPQASAIPQAEPKKSKKKKNEGE